jgi:hemerythrin-like domain-containing protein
MTPSSIRIELLEQHAELRKLVDSVRLCTDPLLNGAHLFENLASAIDLLSDALQGHNLREEHLLRDLVANVDAWGEARADIMTSEHSREHAAIQGSLAAMAHAPSAFAAGDVGLILDELLGHMAREEEVFLNEIVLRDDFVATDPFGG